MKKEPRSGRKIAALLLMVLCLSAVPFILGGCKPSSTVTVEMEKA